MIPKRKLKPIDYVLIGLAIVVVIGMFLFLAAPQWLFTKGIMPSEDEAKALKSDALILYDQKDENVVPEKIQKHNPLSIEKDENGVLILFRKADYQDYGYYYCKKGLKPPERRKRYCVKKITDGVYYYYVAW